MQSKHWIVSAVITVLAAITLGACASNSEPEKDPIFDVTPGGQGQQQGSQSEQ